MKPAMYLVSLAALAAGSLCGQQVISAKAGLVHYVEGKVLLDGKPVNPKTDPSDPKFAEFPQMKANSVLSAGEGRAEVLMNAGVFLWLAENSEMTLLSSSISDSRLRLNKGSALLEADELLDGSAVTVQTGNATVTLAKQGVYRFDADPGRLMVYSGEASVDIGGQMQRVKKGRLLMLSGTTISEKFDTESGDALFRWAKRRAESFAMANVSAARSTSYRSGSSWTRSGWVFNPYYGMYTFVPAGGMFQNFWGYQFWSPATVYMFYQPRPAYYPNTGGGGRSGWSMDAGPRGISASSSGVSGVVSGAASAAASSPTPAPPPAASASPHPGGAVSGRSR